MNHDVMSVWMRVHGNACASIQGGRCTMHLHYGVSVICIGFWPILVSSLACHVCQECIRDETATTFVPQVVQCFGSSFLEGHQTEIHFLCIIAGYAARKGIKVRQGGGVKGEGDV